MPLSHEFWIQIFVYIVSLVVFVAVNSFKIGQLKAELATKDQLSDKVKERNHLIDRVYERFDQFKGEVHDQFVRKDMCGQMHIQSKDELKRIDDEYKEFRHAIRNQIQMLVDKIDQLKEMIQEMKK